MNYKKKDKNNNSKNLSDLWKKVYNNKLNKVIARKLSKFAVTNIFKKKDINKLY